MQAEVKELVELRRQIGEYDEAYEKATSPLKLRRDALQAKITEELKKAGVLSQRFQEATVTRAVKKTVQVLDETKAVAALKAKGLTDYVSETLNPLFCSIHLSYAPAYLRFYRGHEPTRDLRRQGRAESLPYPRVSSTASPCACARWAPGSRKLNRAPRPGADSTHMSPP